jgi:hypothetical protein
MNNRRAQIRKTNPHLSTQNWRQAEKTNWLSHLIKKSNYSKAHSTNFYKRQGEKTNWLMVIITFFLQLLASIIFFSDSKPRKKRLGR